MQVTKLYEAKFEGRQAVEVHFSEEEVEFFSTLAIKKKKLKKTKNNSNVNTVTLQMNI